jgi:glycosyltransferase involved in cell wall biosynthesis
MNIVVVGITENNFIRGVERYTLELVRNLAILYPDITIHLLKGTWQGYYDSLSKYNNVKLINIEDLKNTKIHRHFFLAFRLFDFLKNQNIKADIIHYNNTLPIIKKTPIPSVITIHDIAEFFVPEKYSFLQRFYRKNMVKISAKNADLIITVSKFSATSIIRYLNVPAQKVKPIYLGIEHFIYEDEKDNNEKFDQDENYILYWSVIEHSKGIVETIKAFNLFNKKYPEFKLYIIGKEGNAFNYFSELKRSNPNIIYKGYVKDSELKKFIKKAKVILFPSKYEGFGFPALEAFVINNNVITSNIASLGEITKEFAVQVNPNNINEIAKAIENLVKNPREFDTSKKRSILNNFSWEKTAKETFKCYKHLYEKN